MNDLTDMFDQGAEMAPWAVEMVINLAIALAIFVCGKLLLGKVTQFVEKRLLKASVDPAVAGFAASILYALMFAGVVLMALGQLGIETTSFIAILGAAGLAVGLALQGSLSNFASGVLIILLRPFKSGDFIDAAGQTGSVDRIELFSTYLKTPDNRVVIIPNSAITGGTIVNFSRETTRRIDLVIGIGYDADIKLAKQVMQEIIDADGRILKTPACTIAVAELADSSVNFVLRPWVNSTDYWAVRADVLEAIKYSFDAKGVTIPFPQMDVHLHKPD